MRVALYFGSFNPLHIGHLALADYVLEFGGFDELWFIVSPRNPFKKQQDLLEDGLRLEIVRQAVKGEKRMRASDVEFFMPKPSYTIDTLRKLKSLHEDAEFTLLMGGDNFGDFPKWREADEILRLCRILVYPRPGYELPEVLPDGFTLLKAPLMDISSTFIRQSLAQGRNMRFFLHETTYPLLKDLDFSALV